MIRWLDEVEARRAGGIKWTAVDDGVLAAWVAEMDAAPPPEVTAALTDAVDRHAVLYPLLEGHDDLTTAIARWHADRLGQPVEADRVLYSGDVLAGLVFALANLLEPGTEVVLPVPAYPPFFDAIGHAGMRTRLVPMTRTARTHHMDLDRMEAALAAGAGAVLVCNPHNPTGSAATTDELAAIARMAATHDALVVSDEVHAPLALPGRTVTPMSVAAPEAADRLVTLSSGSKAYNLPGLRFAWIVSHDPDVAGRLAAKPFHERGAWSNLGQVAQRAALESDPAWLSSMAEDLASRHDMVADALGPVVGIDAISDPDASFLSWVDMSGTRIGADPAAALLEAGVRLEPGPRFGEVGTGFVRINLGAAAATLEQVLGRVVGVL